MRRQASQAHGSVTDLFIVIRQVDKTKKGRLNCLPFLCFRTPAESRTHADYQQVANYFVTNPHVVTNSFQTGNKRLKMSSR